MNAVNDEPRRRLAFLQGLTALSRRHGIVIVGCPELVRRDVPTGRYCINPNDAGPQFGWQDATTGDRHVTETSF